MLWNMRITQVFAHHRSVPGSRQRVIVGLPGTGLGELDPQLLQQLCHLVVDVFRTVIRMKAKDDKREPIQSLPDDWMQVRLTDLLAGGDKLHLCHTIHRVDVIHPFHPILVALVDAVDADITRQCHSAVAHVSGQWGHPSGWSWSNAAVGSGTHDHRAGCTDGKPKCPPAVRNAHRQTPAGHAP